jgi:hypothetical protein
MQALRRRLGRALARYLSQTDPCRSTGMPTDIGLLLDTLQRGDVLLVEGISRVSTAIKYLTQSTWSHAALFVGLQGPADGADRAAGPSFVEADLVAGVRLVGAREFEGLHVRICRPVGLRPDEIDRVCQLAMQRLGHAYDLKNITDLARYLLPTPPVPTRWRRRLLALGSGEPTRAICSTLVAQCFQSVRYPILPRIESLPADDPECKNCIRTIMHIRHHSLFAPRDFDLSPYFAVVKPTLAAGFDPHTLQWSDAIDPPAATLQSRG